jgi:lipopolysaccharide/colanic/teichoic acid biosynthesis glycosyltransferase
MVTNADAVLKEHLSRDPELRKEWELTQKLVNDPRVLPVGKLLRKTSLDELPQLWNVIRGEMSLVGPRPIVDAEVPRYGNIFAYYKMVRPGVTGMWQISGRSNTTYSERVRYDEYFVRNWSIWLDLYILFRTVKTVLLREGAC